MQKTNKGGLEDISDVLETWLDKKKYKQKCRDFDAFHNWEKIVGNVIAKNTRPKNFYKDVLVIYVRNSAWTQELQFLKPQLLEKIRLEFPATKIRDLMFRVGPVK